MVAPFASRFSKLDREAASAAAAAGGVRVVELEASFVDAVQVVNDGSLHERSELAVHHDRDAVLRRDQIAGFVDSSVKTECVFEAAAATGFDDDSQNSSVRDVLFGDEPLDFGRCLFGQSNRCIGGGRIGDVL